MKVHVISEGVCGEQEVLIAAQKGFVRREEGKVTVNRQYREGKIITKEEDEEEVIDVFNYQQPVAHVSVSYAKTINLGNYESIKLQVGVTVPCYVEEIDDAFEYAAIKGVEYIRREVGKVKK